MQYDIIVVGAGISGATMAERFASQENKKVLVVEKRDHIGGNCFDYLDQVGIRVSKYGAHIFHTNDEGVWQYINRFSKWRPYIHKVLSFVDGKLVPIPVNAKTVNLLFGLNLDEKGMKEWLKENQVRYKNPKNAEEMAKSRVGNVLYEKMFKNYTKKQWDMEPILLDASVTARIPVHDSFDDRWFADKYQVMPEDGYTRIFENMLKNPRIEVQLNTDYFNIQGQLLKIEKIVFTAPIDRYFYYNSGYLGKLPYRSLRFKYLTYNVEYYQENSVINYPNEHRYTRSIEYKRLFEQKHHQTTIAYEYPTWEGEPYYPVPNSRNNALYEKYKARAEKLKNTHFVGRLGNYKYLNMDQAFRNALDLFDKVKHEG